MSLSDCPDHPGSILYHAFRIFRGPLFHKLVMGQELFFVVSYSIPALEHFFNIWILVKWQMKFYEEFGHIGQMQELRSEKRSVFIITASALRVTYGNLVNLQNGHQSFSKMPKANLWRVLPHCANERASFREEKRLHHHFHCFSSTCYIRLPFLIFLNSNNSVDLGW